MARIVLVHGAFNELWGPNELKARWLPAVRDGLWHHGVEVSEHDVDVCFYGDLFRRHPGTEEEELLGQARPGIAEVLGDLEGADALAALADAASEAVFERTVDMVAVMTTEPEMRDCLRERIETVIHDDTRVLVAHSFGTVVAYSALAAHPEWPVHTFVTLGSPMAAPRLFEGLNPSPVEGRGVWPGSVARWTNVRALNDKACSSSLADKFGPQVEEASSTTGTATTRPSPT
jgi:pimeloyl-ACP methyl ester carboxylesterase